jgi:mono/diheme cytochrome c family protein
MSMMTPSSGHELIRRHRLLRQLDGIPMKRHAGGLVFVASTLLALLSPPSRAEELSGYSGAQLYRRFCASCHGPDAHGDGPVAASLRVLVPDLTLLANRHGGTFPADQVRKIVDGRTVQPPHGSRDMPVWGTEFQAAAPPGSDQRNGDDLIDRLVDYLRGIQHARPR